MFKFLDKEINYTDVIEQCMKKAKLDTDELLPLCGIFYTDFTCGLFIESI